MNGMCWSAAGRVAGVRIDYFNIHSLYENQLFCGVFSEATNVKKSNQDLDYLVYNYHVVYSSDVGWFY